MARVNMDLIRSIEWGKSYLWDFVIDDKDFPFEWVPAIDVEEISSVVESDSIEGGQTSFKVPKTTGVKEVKITFIDDINHRVYSYFEKWLNTITMNDNMYVSTLEECSKLVQILRLDNDRKTVVKQSVYWVYPDGTLTFIGNSDSDKLQYQISFVVVGEARKSSISLPKSKPNNLSFETISLRSLFE